MSIRDDILAGLRAAESGSIGDETPEQLLDAYRAEVLAEAAAAADFHSDYFMAAELRRMAADGGESRG